jgi:cbb3-type cytochrome oxidase maturation protein
MNILYLLVPAAVLLAAIGVAAFAWAVRTGQFDDVDTPPVRAILDEEPAGPSADAAEIPSNDPKPTRDHA